MPSKRQLKIFVYSIEGVGHVNACLGISQSLKKRGHDIIFFLEEVWRGKLDEYGFTFEYFRDLTKETKELEKKDENPGQHLGNVMKEMGMIGKGDSYEKFANINKFCENTFNRKSLLAHEADLKEQIDRHQPDVFILDHFQLSPYINYSGKPWVRIVSTTPFFFETDFDMIPPAGSGYPVDGDRKNWSDFRKLNLKMICDARWNELVTSLGFPPYPEDQKSPPTYALSIYGYPEELSYKDRIEYPKNWVNVETLMRPSDSEHFEVPRVLEEAKKDYPGKLIYLSLGSMCSVDLVFMSKLISILSKTKHRYIVSKGPRHSEYELPANMWGDRFLPQMDVLKKVDLVIGHGGNNTFTETIANGKPIIIFPMFGDQFDNGQRVTEVGLGQRFDAYNFEERDLLAAIERLLYDKTVQERLAAISKRILGNKDRYSEASDRIEELVK